MKLRVYVECVDCRQRVEVHMIGRWDISEVQHTCAGSALDHFYRSRGVGRGEPSKFDITYSPPRTTF